MTLVIQFCFSSLATGTVPLSSLADFRCATVTLEPSPLATLKATLNLVRYVNSFVYYIVTGPHF